jgi:hypothetical protein
MNNIHVSMNGETGGTMGPNGRLQNRRIKAALVKEFGSKAVVSFSPNHYCCTAFIQFSENNIVYFSASDYRFFPQSFYVRSAKHNKDYTGGSNYHYNDFNEIIPAINFVKERINKP